MTNDKILTVVVPTKNTTKYLDRCLSSILNQSLKNINILVIDDGSADNPKIIIDKYQNAGSEIGYFKNAKSLGPGESRNIGLRKSNTKYVTFLDSDDWVDTNAYLSATNALEENETVDIAIFGIKTELENELLSSIRYSYNNLNIVQGQFALNLLTRTYNQDVQISALLGNKVFRNSTLKSSGLEFVTATYEDVVFSFISVFIANKVVLIPGSFLHYYQRESSIMHSFSKRYIDDLLENFLNLKEFLIKKNVYTEFKPQLFSYFEKCCQSMIQSLFYAEQNSFVQKKYIAYFLTETEKVFPLVDRIDYIDVSRLKNLFLYI